MSAYSWGVNPMRPVACIGVFDGVHTGHQRVIAQGRLIAQQDSRELIAVTFDPHPMRVVQPDRAPEMIGTLEQRKARLLDSGADRVHVITFTPEVSEQSSEEFVQQTLVEALNVGAVVVGSNFTFGHRARGTVDTLRDLGDKFSFSVTEVDLSGETSPVSSSRIRAHLRAGEISQAQELLGHPFAMAGEVVYGDQRGRQLGYPTANLKWDTGQYLVIPADGVYAGYVHHGETRDPAAISVGTNPQFEGAERRIEAHILDRTDYDLYGLQVEFEFTKFLREQKVFGDLDDYLAQMAIDVQSARELVC